MSSVCPNGHTSSADDYCDVCGAPIDAAQQPPSGSAPAASSAGTSAAGGASAPTAGGPITCPHCGTENVAEALFCEACGYDFTTGTLPRTDPADETPADGAPADGAPAGGQPDPGTGAVSSTASPADAAPSLTSTPDTTGSGAGGSGAGGSGAGGSFQFVAEIWIDPAWYEAQQSPDPLPSPGLPEVVPLRKSSVLIGRLSRSRNIHPDIDCEPDSGASRRQAQLTTDGTRWWVEDLESANGTFVASGSDALPQDPIPVGTKVQIDPDDRIYVGAWTRIVVREATADEQESLA